MKKILSLFLVALFLPSISNAKTLCEGEISDPDVILPIKTSVIERAVNEVATFKYQNVDKKQIYDSIINNENIYVKGKDCTGVEKEGFSYRSLLQGCKETQRINNCRGFMDFIITEHNNNVDIEKQGLENIAKSAPSAGHCSQYNEVVNAGGFLIFNGKKLSISDCAAITQSAVTDGGYGVLKDANGHVYDVNGQTARCREYMDARDKCTAYLLAEYEPKSKRGADIVINSVYVYAQFVDALNAGYLNGKITSHELMRQSGIDIPYDYNQ